MELVNNIEIDEFNYYKYPEQTIPSMEATIKSGNNTLGTIVYIKFKKSLTFIFETNKVKEHKELLDKLFEELGFIINYDTKYSLNYKISLSYDEFKQVSQNLIDTLNEYIKEIRY